MSQTDNPYAAPASPLLDSALPSVAGLLADPPNKVGPLRGVRWIREGWDLFMAQPGTWIALSVCLSLLVIGFAVLPLIGLLSNLIATLFFGGVMLGVHAQANGGRLRLGHLFDGFRESGGALAKFALMAIGVSFLAAFVFLVIVVVVITVGVGTSLGTDGLSAKILGGASALSLVVLVTAGCIIFIPLQFAAYLGVPLVAVNRVAPWAAYKLSLRATLRNIWPLSVYLLLSALVTVLGALALIIGIFIAYPILLASCYAAYRELLTITQADAR